MKNTINLLSAIIAHQSPKGVVVKDGYHSNHYTGSRYGWSILLIGRKTLPDYHELDVVRQQTSRYAIPYYDDKNVRLIKRGYICK